MVPSPESNPDESDTPEEDPTTSVFDATPASIENDVLSDKASDLKDTTETPAVSTTVLDEHSASAEVAANSVAGKERRVTFNDTMSVVHLPANDRMRCAGSGSGGNSTGNGSGSRPMGGECSIRDKASGGGSIAVGNRNGSRTMGCGCSIIGNASGGDGNDLGDNSGRRQVQCAEGGVRKAGSASKVVSLHLRKGGEIRGEQFVLCAATFVVAKLHPCALQDQPRSTITHGIVKTLH